MILDLSAFVTYFIEFFRKYSQMDWNFFYLPLSLNIKVPSQKTTWYLIISLWLLKLCIAWKIIKPEKQATWLSNWTWAKPMIGWSGLFWKKLWEEWVLWRSRLIWWCFVLNQSLIRFWWMVNQKERSTQQGGFAKETLYPFSFSYCAQKGYIALYPKWQWRLPLRVSPFVEGALD